SKFGLYKSASHHTPQYLSTKIYQPKIDRENSIKYIKSSSSSPVYQMPAYYIEPKTVYKNVPYKAAASNPVPILNLNAEQIKQLYHHHSMFVNEKRN
ncbi:hypothetical protein BLA29_013386, partial [Euroglyphus maynei]